MNIEIRPIDPNRLADICIIHNQAFSEWIESLGIVYGYQQITENDVKKWVEPESSQILVAYEENKPIGYIHFAFETRKGDKNPTKQVVFVETTEGIGQSKVAVIPNKRKKGVASSLIQCALNYAKEQNTEVAVVYSYNKNHSMNDVLQNLDFSHTPIFHYPPFSASIPLAHDTILAEFDLTQEIPLSVISPNLDVQFREFRKQDLSDLHQIFAECRPDILENSNSKMVTDYWLEQRWAEKTFVAELRGEVVGCMEYNKEGLIGIPGVKIKHQRKGIGTRLLYELLGDMKSIGYSKALADTGVVLPNAIKLYQKLSFNTSRILWAWIKVL